MRKILVPKQDKIQKYISCKIYIFSYANEGFFDMFYKNKYQHKAPGIFFQVQFFSVPGNCFCCLDFSRAKQFSQLIGF